MIVPIAAFLLIGAWLLLIAPGRSTREQKVPFAGRTFAHRGLYRKDQSVPENSLPAFLDAVHAGYGIELDIQLTSDRQIVVFHDDNLKRVCGVDARVDAFTYEELRALPLFDTNQRIPLFSDVLALVDGRVPLIVELKAGGDWRRLCEDSRAMLSAYRGAYCIESFHPGPVHWYRVHAPEVLRGQLSEAYRFSHEWVPWYTAFGMSRLLTNAYTRAQFIAYRIGPRCLSVRVSEWLGAVRVSWTARPEHDWIALTRRSDAIIFEHMRPPARFTRHETAAPILLEERAVEKSAQALTDALTDACPPARS